MKHKLLFQVKKKKVFTSSFDSKYIIMVKLLNSYHPSSVLSVKVGTMAFISVDL